MITFLLVVLVVLGAWTLYEVVRAHESIIAISQAQAIIAAKVDEVSERLDRMEDS